MSYSLTSYDKQMKWQKARQKETETKRLQKSLDDSSNFTPAINQSRPKDFDGTAREINDRSALRFVERMRKGNNTLQASSRSVHSQPFSSMAESQQHQLQQQPTLVSSSYSYDGGHRRSAPVASNTIQQLQAPSSASDIVASYSSQFAQQKTLIDDPALFQMNEDHPSLVHNGEEDDDGDDSSSDSDSGEPIIELLERERRQWQAERERLIQCIHLQQLEMSQRSLAAHERAMDIAKDFSKLIETFENRLETVENNVQRELSNMRTVTESLLLAVNKLTLHNNSNGTNSSNSHTHNGGNAPPSTNGLTPYG